MPRILRTLLSLCPNTLIIQKNAYFKCSTITRLVYDKAELDAVEDKPVGKVGQKSFLIYYRRSENTMSEDQGS